VLDDVRHAAVCSQLAASDLDLAELAARVGFSGTTALHRAFRRWEGTTPIAYRSRTRLAAS
jgi:AraC-like DNA-binding protein